MFSKRNNHGRLEVICGSMFSGKSEELIRRLKRAQIAQLQTLIFKHSLDTRKTIEYIHAHNGDKIKAFAVESAEQIRDFIFEQADVIGIDEVQFFKPEIITIILELIDQKKRVIVAGLDLDFRGLPFGCMPSLLAIADTITKLNAVCMSCGNDAYYSQRLVNGQPARYNDPIIVIGAEECYQARCRECFKIDKKPTFLNEYS